KTIQSCRLSFKSRVVVHGAALSKTQCTNFLKGIFRHYAFPIKSLKLFKIEPIKHLKRIQVEPIRIFSQTYTFYPHSPNQNILAHLLRRNIFQDAEQLCPLSV